MDNLIKTIKILDVKMYNGKQNNHLSNKTKLRIKVLNLLRKNGINQLI
jgi:hypothetical protein